MTSIHATELPATYGGWRPHAVIGATSAFGLMLPEAKPTPSQVYAPRGVHVDDRRVVVADTGNHRVLVFDGVPDSDGASASVVLGQPDAFSEGPNAGGPTHGLNLPTGLFVHEGRLVVADAWNHRVLVWDDVPDSPRPADLVLGQTDAESVEANRGGDPTATSFYWPFGIAVVDGRFYVADTGNRRVLAWSGGIPGSADIPADVVLGQDDATSRAENRGEEASADSFRWPHAIASNGNGGLLVADAGNHRVLGWRAHPNGDLPATYVLGQPDLQTAVEFPYAPQTASGFRFPYAVVSGSHGLAVADTANNRVLLWDEPPMRTGAAATHVLGQPTFAANGENRWEAVGGDTLCWPYGLSMCGDLLAVADSGNNRVVIWERR